MRAFNKFCRELRTIILHRSNSSSKLIMFLIKMANLDNNSSPSLTSSPETLSEITGTAIVNSFTTESVTKKTNQRFKGQNNFSNVQQSIARKTSTIPIRVTEKNISTEIIAINK